MTAEKNRETVNDIVYLLSCSVNGTPVDRERAGKMDLSALYEMADRHLLTGITAMALESAGIRDEAFTQAKGKAVRKVAAMDLDRVAFQSRLEEAGIWYMPLKGAVLKDLYPRMGMRQMSDNDILIDGTRMDDAGTILENMGFACDHRSSVHTVYNRPPVSSFELHRRLFGEAEDRRMCDYYRTVKARLIPDEGKRCGFHFSDEDFYVYMVAHEYKHYKSTGTGLRSLLDTYVYCQKKGGILDWQYIGEETEKLGIDAFERQNRSLSAHLFGGQTLSDGEREQMEYILFSGTYGTIQNKVDNKLREFGGGRKGKLRYVLSRIFLPMDVVRSTFPAFAKVPVLLPFLPVYRLVLGLRDRRKQLAGEWKTLKDR
ncbi:MAG: nucleotidyltransferase family protein [Oscillospiraceae bacterium]|nr:nucleotidyltransferase family protein [Oscillospiraceae bacterium]